MGVAYVVAGPPSGDVNLADAEVILDGESFFDDFGLALAGVGDLDDDGHDDLVIGAPGDDDAGDASGAFYVLHGPFADGVTKALDAATKVGGDGVNQTVGVAVAGLGDVDGDGADDFAVGATGRDEGGANAGMAAIFYGPADIVALADADGTVIGDGDNANAGASIANVGDMDDDGHPDMAVGGYGYKTFAGAAWILSGPVAGAVSVKAATATLLGEKATDFAGYAVAGGGDVNRDGSLDVVVGAFGHDLSDTDEDAGCTYVMFGPLVGTVALSTGAEFDGGGAQAHVGWSVALPGDADGDGFADVLFGAPGAKGSTGSAVLLSGATIVP
jgi:hypothetical protein